MLGLFLYSCWRRHKGLKEGVYHVAEHHGEWEDIRENVLNYDEEGGGEQDQVRSHFFFAGGLEWKLRSSGIWECSSISWIDTTVQFLFNSAANDSGFLETDNELLD